MSGSDQPFDWVAASGRKAKGRRPDYFEDPALDRLYSTVFALAAEVSALRERQDTVERLLDAKGTITREDVETYEPDRTAAEERASRRWKLPTRRSWTSWRSSRANSPPRHRRCFTVHLGRGTWNSCI